MDIFEILRDQALKKSSTSKDEDFIIRGLWKADVIIKLDIIERIARYNSVIAQTVGQGCCHCDTDVSLDPNLIGKDAREFISSRNCISIALLDSIFSSIPKRPQRVYELKGTLGEKIDKRSSIVLKESERLLKDLKGKEIRVVNVGFVGDFVKKLKGENYLTFATDLNEDVIGQSAYGVTIESGTTKTLEYVKNCDLAIITGMAISTNTLDDIVEAAKRHGTRLVIFAETGANFAEEYCRSVGIDVAISEPFPFYVHQGVSRIEVYRR